MVNVVCERQEAYLAGHKKKRGMQTNVFIKHLLDIVILEGDVLIKFFRKYFAEK